MPSLVNFQPLIDASKEGARASQQAAESRARSMEHGVELATQALNIMGQRGRQRETEFQSIFDYDLNKNASKEARGYLANKYRHIKKDGIRMFSENKNFLGYGKLSPEQRIQLDDELDSFKREAELLNVINVQIGNAEKLGAQRKGAIKVDREKIGTYLQLLRPNKEGKYDTDGLAKFISEVDQSPTGQPFTDFEDFDMDFYVQNGGKDAIKAELKPVITTEDVTIHKNGKKYTKKYETAKHGTLEERQNTLYAMISSSKNQDLYDYNIGKMLNEEERDQAIADYGDKVANPMSAYYAYNKADLVTGYEEKRLKGTIERPLSKSESGGRGDYTTIKLTDVGAEFGTTPIPISKEIKGETYKNASITAIKKDENGNWVANLIVPRGKNESFENMIAMREESEGRDMTNTEATALLSEMLNADKVKTIQVPLKDIYKELKVGFEKKKINLQGYDQISFDKTQPKQKFVGVPEGGF